MPGSSNGIERNQAFVFGEVADGYERTRPSYPEALFDDVLEYCAKATPRILEIGAGTGKATVSLAKRGVAVVALEPSAEMAEIAKSNLADFDNAKVVEMTFEGWPEGGAPFDAIVAAQAWHWAEDGKYERAHRVLGPGGVLAAFWNRAVWPEHQLAMRAAVEGVYLELEPQLLDAPAAFPGLVPYGRERVCAAELEASPLFDSPTRAEYGRSTTYSLSSYIDLLGTQSMHRMLEPDRRGRLMAAIAGALETFGDSIDVEIETRLVMARRLP
ncbi:MAG: hypothetical protein DCC49_00695 [Acidobacteria bacterium]|nr:MAG: hypothetical protein DCC49_00695 [Acidobacteriota bacterium]